MKARSQPSRRLRRAAWDRLLSAVLQDQSAGAALTCVLPTGRILRQGAAFSALGLESKVRLRFLGRMVLNCWENK